MTDHLLRCISCPSDFTMTDGEIEFFHGKGFVLPKQCPRCRAARRAVRAADVKATEAQEALRNASSSAAR